MFRPHTAILRQWCFAWPSHCTRFAWFYKSFSFLKCCLKSRTFSSKLFMPNIKGKCSNWSIIGSRPTCKYLPALPAAALTLHLLSFFFTCPYWPCSLVVTVVWLYLKTEQWKYIVYNMCNRMPKYKLPQLLVMLNPLCMTICISQIHSS
jgi:hypothetical protein